MKYIFLALFLLTATLLAETDLRLNHYPKALKWLEDADTNGESTYNIGVIYQQKIKDNEKAIEWYKKAYEMDDEGAAGSAANNLGYLFKNLEKSQKSEEWFRKSISKNNTNALVGLGLLFDSKKLRRCEDAAFYYQKAYKMGNVIGAHNLALMYKNTLNKSDKAIEWYKKAAKDGYADSIKNLARYYKLEKNDNILGGAYFLALIDIKYPKQKVLTYLRTKWKLTDKEIKKAYQLQKTLDIPKHYYDPEYELKSIKKKSGRQ